MLIKPIDTKAWKEFQSVLKDKSHPLHKIAKKISKKTIKHYLNELIYDFKWSYSFDKWEIKQHSKNFFQQFFAMNANYPSKENKFQYSLEAIRLGSNSFWVAIVWDGLYFVEWMGTHCAWSNGWFEPMDSNWITFLRNYDRPESSTFAVNKEWLYFWILGKEIREYIIDKVYNDDDNVVRLVSSSLYNALHYSIGESIYSNPYAMVHYFEKIWIDTSINFYWDTINSINERSDKFMDRYDFEENNFEETNDDWDDEKMFEKLFLYSATEQLNQLYWDSSQEFLLENLMLVEFFNYYETYNLISVKWNEFFKYVDSLSDNISPIDLFNRHIKRFTYSNHSKEMTASLFSDFMSSPYMLIEVWEDYPLATKRSKWYNYNTNEYEYGYSINQGIGLVHCNAFRYWLKDYVVEILSPYCEAFISEKYWVSELKDLRTSICAIQYVEAYENAVGQNIVNDHDLKYLIYDKQGSYFIAEELVFLNDRTIVNIAWGESFEIYRTDMEIDNRYTTGINTTKVSSWFSMTWKMKIACIEFKNDGWIIMRLANERFHIDTDSIKLNLN